MKKYFKKIKAVLRDDKQLIYLTAALIALGGLVRLFRYNISVYILIIGFIPYLLARVVCYWKKRKEAWSVLDKQRFVIFLVMAVTICLNFFSMFKTEFLLLFLLMIDYILVINRHSNQEPTQYTEEHP